MKYLLVALLVLAGCAHPSEKRAQVMGPWLESQVGVATKDEFVRNWGPPTQKETLSDSTEVWVYHTDLGQRGQSLDLGNKLSAVNTSARYERYRLTFDKAGRLSDYRFYINY